MILINVIKSISLFLVLIPIVLCSECDNIDSPSVKNCNVNEEGKIIGLTIDSYELNDDQINNLLSYDLIELKYVVNLGDNLDDPLSYYKNTQFPSAIKNLKNLQSLDIYCYSEYSHSKVLITNKGLISLEKDFLKDLKNLKSLKIGGINISQDNIDDIATLNNLESLTFYKSHLDESLDYKPLSNLKKLTKLEVNNVTGDYVNLETKDHYAIVTPKNLVNSNKGIKELYMYPPVEININDLPNVEKLSMTFQNDELDASFLEQYNNLTNLDISYFRDNQGDPYQGYIKADFSKLKNLKSLHITNINISEEIMNGIADLPNLDELNLQNCKLCEDFPEKLKSLKTLSSLIFDSCGVGNMDIDITPLSNLRKLVINGYNEIMDNIPEGVYSLKQLEYLDISVKNVNEKLSNLENLQYLDLSFGGLEKIPEQIGDLKNLKHLDISQNQLKEIPEQLGNLKNLEYLDLSYNEIENIFEQFGNLTNLKHIDFEGNKLTKLTEQLRNLKNLEYINFNFNNIYADSPEYLNSFENLKYFNIEGNRNLKGKVLINEHLIECNYGGLYGIIYDLCIPKSVKEIKCFQYEVNFKTCDDDNNPDNVNVSTNGLCGKEHGKCPDGQCCNKDGKCGTTEDYCLVTKNCQNNYGHCIDECSEINEKLDVNSKCSVDKEGKAVELLIDVTLYDYEEELGNTQLFLNQLPNFHNIERLTLKDFNLNYINLEPLGKMEKLNNLTIINSSYGTDVYGKKSGEIPEFIFSSLNHLKGLTIINNYIKSIPDKISTLKNLEYLNLSDNLIEEISPNIGELENLKEINLSKNKIKEIPSEFGKLKKLEILNLSHMEGFKNYSNFIGGLESLKVLDLTYNDVCASGDNYFPKEIGNLSNLEEFYFHGNWIREIPNEIGNLKNLRILDLSDNQISEIPEFLKNMEKLEILDLSGNSIDDEVVEEFKSKYLNKKTTTTITSTSTNKSESTTNSITTTNDPVSSTTTSQTTNDKSVSSTTVSQTTTDEPVSYATTSQTTTDEPVSYATTSQTTTDEPVSSATTSQTTTDEPVSSTTVSQTTTDKSVSSTTVSQTTTDEPVSSTTVSQTITDKSVPTSVNGRCGKDYGKCPSGQCCSKYGWCGKSDDHCNISKGCNSEFGICNNTSTTTIISTITKTKTTTSEKPEPTVIEGKCGEGYGKCPSGQCCSKYGWCGESDDHCNIFKGCKSEFGKCNNSDTPETNTFTSENPEPSVIEGKCGEGYGNCPVGQCCSKYGWCGKGYDYCAVSEGCQSKYGLCSEINSSLEGKCGKEYGSCPSGQCCSKYGWCGTSLAHCGTGCQSEFGKCN